MRIDVYRRAIGLLWREPWLVVGLAASNVVIALVQLAEPVLFGRVVDRLTNRGDAMELIAIWAGLGLIGIVAGVAVAVAADRLAHRRTLIAVSAAFEKAITLPVSFHAARGSGAVVRIILAGTHALFWIWLGFFREQLSALVGIVLLVPTALSLDVRMAAILGALAVIFVLLNVIVVRKTSLGQTAVERYHTEVYGRVGDVIGNVSVVQSYTRLAAEMATMRSLMDKVLAAQYPVLTWWGLLTVLTHAAGTITMVAVFAAGAALAARGEITVGEIVSFIALAGLLIGKLDQLSGFVVRVFQEIPTLASYFDLIDQPDPVVEKPDARPLENVAGRVCYEGVSYRYGPGEQGVFDLDFAVEPGQTVAIVGPSGAGKTTAAALLQRMRSPDVGRITVDGHDIADVTVASLRRSIAVVFQDAGLFNRTILENIQIGRPEATVEEVERAARLAEAHDFITRKPGGYDFVIGERGGALSGGERQRIAIARAILKDAPILIMDEATSALDTETEGRIKRGLDALRRGRTTLIIAHRLSTVANADHIVVMDGGRIVERGRFATLTAQGGLFTRLVVEGGFTQPIEPQP